MNARIEPRSIPNINHIRNVWTRYIRVAFLLPLCLWIAADIALAAVDKSGVRPQVLSLPSGPGSIEGLGESFEPQLNSGTASYAVPLKLPPGRAGFAPMLVLRYNSGQGNGAVGMGWSLNLPIIQRQTEKGLPEYDDTHDRFVYGTGEELVYVGVDAASGARQYRLKIEEQFALFLFYADEDRWEMRGKNGLRRWLGTRANGLSEPGMRTAHPDNFGQSFDWRVGEERDTNGNRIIYDYFADQNQGYCTGIRYGALEANALAGEHRVVFTYEARPDSVVDYRPTFRRITALRLQSVSMHTGSTLVRRYDLAYTEGGGLSLLASVIQVGNDGDSRLPPAEFTYTALTPVTTAELRPLAGLGGTYILREDQSPAAHPGAAEIIDFDADDLPDLYVSRYAGGDPFEHDIFYKNLGRGVFRRIALTQAQSAPLSIQGSRSFLRDINGDGAVDLVAQKGANPEAFVFRLNHQGVWSATETPFTIPTGENADALFLNAEVRVADLNGNRQIDSLRSWRTVTSQGSGIVFTAFFNQGDGAFERVSQTTEEIIAGLPVTFAESGGRLLLVDMNGDRLLDLVLLQDATNGGIRWWPAMGFGRFDNSIGGYRMMGGPDYRGDNSQMTRWRLEDLTGNGFPDLIRISGYTIRIHLNRGGQFFEPEQSISLEAYYNPAVATWRILDVDGDGVQDLFFYVSRQSLPDDLPAGFFYCKLFQGDKAFQLRSITNGIGRTTTISYRSSIEDMIRDRLDGRSWPQNIPFPVPVIARVDVNDGMITSSTEFSYHDGYYDGAEKEFRGFAAVTQRKVGDESVPELIMAHTFDNGVYDEALKGKPIEVSTKTASGDVFYREEQTWNTRVIENGQGGDTRKVTFPYQSAQTRNITEQGLGTPIQLQWEYEYDNYGNMIRQVEHGRMDTGWSGSNLDWNDERITIATFSAGYPSGLAAWMLDKPVTREIQDANGAVIARQWHFYDDEAFNTSAGRLGLVSRGNLTMTLDWVAPDEPEAYIRSVRNRYDAHGNITAILDPLYGIQPGHYRELSYDDTFHTFPVREDIHTGRLTLTMQTTYDYGLGQMTTSTDYNGHTTRYRYDPFGRLAAVVKPGDTTALPTTAYDYLLAHALPDGRHINWVETRQREISGQAATLNSRAFFDGLGRKIMTRSAGETANQVVVTDTVQHNIRQTAWKKYLPYFDTGGNATLDWRDPTWNSGYTEHHYDALGRETIVFQPAAPGETGRVYSQVTYEPLARTVRDEEQTRPASPHYGSAMRYVEDGLLNDEGQGRLRVVQEIVRINDDGTPRDTPATWTTTYSYDLLENLTGYVDSRNNRKHIVYDGLGRKIFMNDPDRSWMWYVYDAAGNLIRTRDARGQEVAYAYDGANRMTAEYYCEPQENLGDALGQITRVSQRWVLNPADLPARSGDSPDVRYHYDTAFGPITLPDVGPARP